MGTPLEIVCFVILLAIVIVSNVFNIKRKKQIQENATAITEGRIVDIKFCEGDRQRDCFYYWKISYSAKGGQYTLKSGDSGMTKSQMLMHIGETVVVHYDPDHPEKARAVVHGVTAWSGAGAF